MPNPADILRLLGVSALANYIVNEVQEVYRLQGVKINDKHIEVIVRQMLRKAEVLDSGGTRLLRGEQLDRARVLEANERAKLSDEEPATWQPVFAGYHQSIAGDGVFHLRCIFPGNHPSANGGLRVNGKIDELRGLKENVIVGRLIPAGTGFAYHQDRRRRRREEAHGEPTAEAVQGNDGRGDFGEYGAIGRGVSRDLNRTAFC